MDNLGYLEGLFDHVEQPIDRERELLASISGQTPVEDVMGIYFPDAKRGYLSTWAMFEKFDSDYSYLYETLERKLQVFNAISNGIKDGELEPLLVLALGTKPAQYNLGGPDRKRVLLVYV